MKYKAVLKRELARYDAAMAWLNEHIDLPYDNEDVKRYQRQARESSSLICDCEYTEYLRAEINSAAKRTFADAENEKRTRENDAAEIGLAIEREARDGERD